MSKENSVGTVDRADIVIVGNGIAGLTAAVEARRLEPEKSIVIVTNQSHPTINTPALKQFAIGKLTREQLLAYPAGTERMQRIHLVNAYVEEIRAQAGYLRLSGGQGFGYGSLLLATGSRPMGLPPDVPGQDFDGVMTLHRLYDYLDLRRRLPEVEEVVVIGGGPHAVETVMGLLYWGIRVHWLIRSATFMPRMLDRPASDLVLENIRRAGAKIYTETEVVGIVGRVGLVAGVVTTQQQMLPCQLVLVCTGTTAVTMLARNCDLPIKHDRGGILVDDQLRTSARNIYAAGDVAALRDPLTGKYAPRAQWYAAVLQGRAVASAMTGAEESESFGVPWHATRLGDLSMLTVGHPLAGQESVVPLTERRKGSYCLLSVVDDRLVGYLSLGSVQPDSLAIKRIIDEGLSVREITKDLLRGEFDARKYFSGKRTYAAQRMVTTGQLPTPLPPMPGIMAGESRGESRATPRLNALLPVPREAPRGGETAARLNAVSPLASSKDREPQRRETAARLNAVPPLVSPKEGTATRLNAVPSAAAEKALPTKEDEAWVNAQPQRDGEAVGWMNAAPAFPVNSRQPAEASPRASEDSSQHPATEPLVHPVPMRTGSRSVTGPRKPVRQTDEQRRKIAEQKTIFNGEVGADTEPRPHRPQADQKTIFSGEIGADTEPRPNKPRPEQKAIFSGEIGSSTEPRPRKRVQAEQRTALNGEIGRDTEPRATKQQDEVVELVTKTQPRQFIAPPIVRTTVQPEKTSNPHPSRSLWHYTDKHPAVGGKKHVQE
jgi:NADPH-dependent 2,4-dienoyl-CoA reductase/sulfur reductase-like enzyme